MATAYSALDLEPQVSRVAGPPELQDPRSWVRSRGQGQHQHGVTRSQARSWSAGPRAFAWPAGPKFRNTSPGGSEGGAMQVPTAGLVAGPRHVQVGDHVGATSGCGPNLRTSLGKAASHSEEPRNLRNCPEPSGSSQLHFV